MRQSRILGFFAACLFGLAACASSDPEPPLTPASYTPMPRTPNETVARRASRPPAPAQKPELLAREVQPPVVTGTEGDDSRTAIALARCEREARCKNVGADREYVTEEDCIARLEPDTERELEARECPRSIAPARLGACMQAIREESCDRPRDLAPIDACGAAALCPKN